MVYVDIGRCGVSANETTLHPNVVVNCSHIMVYVVVIFSLYMVSVEDRSLCINGVCGC